MEGGAPGVTGPPALPPVGLDLDRELGTVPIQDLSTMEKTVRVKAMRWILANLRHVPHSLMSVGYSVLCWTL